MTKSPGWESSLKLFHDEYLLTKNFTSNTRKYYVAILKDLKAFLSDRFDVCQLNEITSYHLRKYMRQLSEEGFSRKKLNQRTNVTRSFFTFLVEQEIIPDNPSLDLTKIRNRPEEQPRLFSSRENLSHFGEPSRTNLDSAKEEPIEASSNPLTYTAHDIKEYLDTKVVGQEDAKLQISVLLSMHMNWFKQEERMHRSPNAIVIGPTGVGKTHTLRIASEYLKIPFIAVDTTSIVQSGIAGLQIEDILADLVLEANDVLKRGKQKRVENDDIDLARRGIIFFDEFDKINSEKDSTNYNSSANLAVQRRFLKLTDGGILGIGVRGHIKRGKNRSIDTSGILIIAGGAFTGIDSNKIRTLRAAELQRELSKSNPNIIVSADIVNYGFMPELVARLPVLVEYRALGQTDLLKILERPEISPLQVWIEHFHQLGKELVITDDAKRYAAKRASILKMGARGLHQIIFPALARLAFDIEVSSKTIYTINAEKLSKITQKN